MQFPAVDHLLTMIHVHILGAVFGLSVFQYAPKCLISSYWRSECFPVLPDCSHTTGLGRYQLQAV